MAAPQYHKTVKITVILCTFNRCQSLSRALDSAAAQTLPNSVDWEVLVVDNNSNDQTHEVVENFCRQYPGRFRYMFEPQQGKSHALNTGIREARGDVLAFTDDDVTVEPTWLQHLTTPLLDGEWAGSGGRVLPEQNFSLPAWVPLEERYGLGPLAMFDLGPEAGQLTESPFGNNMAFRKGMFNKYGGFRTDLGPQRDSKMPGEDTEFGDRLLAAGEHLRYEPSAIVYHFAPQDRLQKKYFLAWWFNKARADIRRQGILPDKRWFLAGIPLYMFRRLAVWMLRWMFAIGPSRRFSSKVKVWFLAGQIAGTYRLWLS